MSKLAISQTPTTITVVDQSTANVYTITNTQPNWGKVVEAIKNEDNDAEIVNLISVKTAVESFLPTGNIEIRGNDVLYKGNQLQGLDVDHLLEAVRTGNKRQSKALTKFLENKQLNPSYRAVNMMYKFRMDRGMPLTDDGCFLAYKGVGSDYWSINCNKKTIVLSGRVNEGGHIWNGVGEYIEVARHCVEDDSAKSCGEGLHAGSLEYASNWGSKVVIIKIHPKDVVSVPDAEDNKMRVCAYTVVGECEGKMPQYFAPHLNVEASEDNEDEEGFCPGCGELEGDNFDGDHCYTCGWDIDEDVEGDDDCSCNDPQCSCNQTKVERGNSPVDYSDGYEAGEKDGRAHARRQYYNGDEFDQADSDATSYVKGYNAGYNRARYGK